MFAALQALGFREVRRGAHIAMIRANPDGTRTPLMGGDWGPTQFDLEEWEWE